MIYSPVTSWRPQLFLLAGGWPAPLRAMPPVQSAPVNKPLGEKKSSTQKMIESWKEEYDTHMPCYCPRHVSQVKALVAATGLPSLCSSGIHMPSTYSWLSLLFFLCVWISNIIPIYFEEASWFILCSTPLSSPNGFDFCLRLSASKGRDYSWPRAVSCVLKCSSVTCHLTNPWPWKTISSRGDSPCNPTALHLLQFLKP